MTESPDYLSYNQETWTKAAPVFAERAVDQWAGDARWGIWEIPETEAGVLPDVAGLDVLEAGCGTAYVSAWLARRGAHCVGLDPTAAQLDTARKMQQDFELYFPLVRAPAEAMPFPDESFDLVISEYGACLWSDPYAWVPEAARVLRRHGRLIFLTTGVILVLAMHDDDQVPARNELLRPYFDMHRFEWPGEDDGIEFHLTHGDWIQLLRREGFEVEDLLELRPAPEAKTVYPFVTLDWARKWPSEEVWKARRVR